MNISQGFKLAIKSLLARKVRSLLTMLGIIMSNTLSLHDALPICGYCDYDHWPRHVG